MPNIDPKERFKAYASQPYQPSHPQVSGGAEANAAVRAAHALEYIAAQLGQINAKLDLIVKKGDETP